MNRMNNFRAGEITTGVLVTLGVGAFMAVSGFFAKAWFTDTRIEMAGIKQSQAETFKIDGQQTTDISVLKSQIMGIDARTTRTEDKIDLLLKNQGLIYKEKNVKK